MTLICIIAKLLTIKIKHMKKLFILLGVLLLTGCATSNSIAYEPNFKHCSIPDCEITSIHNHVFID